MEGLVVSFVLACLILFISGVVVGEEPGYLAGYALSVLGTALFVAVTFLVAPQTLHTGSPASSIGAGEYQVAFVYVVGDNVSVGVEREDGRFGEGVHLFLYQFPGNAFEGGVKDNAKKLTVIESGEFKKLRLE